ncbi:MAG: BlaI/MecI/CopY family transcriptional regulator [Firmicutes bacterium]|nr:BlaI/MecI/CopY family transcriptional regulator [Bacillota bacterium]
MKGYSLGGYKPGKPGLEKVLGSLENEVMEIIWKKNCEVSVRDVLDALTKRRDLAYTTVMTIMGRLEEKNILEKRKVGNAFIFKPVLSREEFTGQVVGGLIDDLLNDFSDTAMSHFIRRVEEKDRSVLEKLEKSLTENKESEDDSNI